MLFGEFCFDAAIAAAVAGDGDFSGDADSQLFELAIIRLHAVIHIDDGSGDVSGRRKGVEADDDIFVEGVGIHFERLFGSGKNFFVGRGEFQLDFARLRQPDAIADDFGIEAVAAILVAQPFRHAVAGFGAGHVRLAGNVAQIAFGARGIGNCAHLLFEGAFGGYARGREAADAEIFLLAAGNCGGKYEDACENDCRARAPLGNCHSHLVEELQILYYMGAARPRLLAKFFLRCNVWRWMRKNMRRRALFA